MISARRFCSILLLIFLQCMTTRSQEIESILADLFSKIGACSDYYQYSFDNNFIIAKLLLPNLKLNDTVKLQFFKNDNTFSPYFFGSLFPDESSQEVINKLQNNQSISYRVDFPVAVGPAILEDIFINDNELCATQFSSDSTKKLVLQHTLQIVDDAIPVQTHKNITVALAEEPQPPITGSLNSLCGKSGTEERNEYPWLAAIYLSLGTGQIFHITGSLISEGIVLSAANKFYQDTGMVPFHLFKIYLGRFNLGDASESSHVTRNIETLIVSPDYKWKNSYLGNDVALLKIKPVGFTKYIRPICLWADPAEESLVGKPATLLSWDQVGVNTKILTIPRSKDVDIIPTEYCQLSGIYVGAHSFLCTPRLAHYTDGMLMVKRYGRWVLRGLYTKKTQTVEFDVIYLYQKTLEFPFRAYYDIANNISWIQEHM